MEIFMLNTIDIKNIAVIEKLNIDFTASLNVLTGETGAGKSIIIDSINLILGARASRTLIRHGEEKAYVGAMFSVGKELSEPLAELGINASDGELLITREITADGRSLARINSEMVPQQTLRAVSDLLINIHGQHDNQALLTPARHIDFLDSFAKNGALLAEYRDAYEKMCLCKRKAEELSRSEQERIQRIDMLKYQCAELAAAALSPGEKDALTAERAVLNNAEKISLALGRAYELLYGGENGSAYDALGIASDELSAITGLDEKIDAAAEKIFDLKYNLEDAVHELYGLNESIEFDEERLNEIEERLDLITRLERKYGGSEKSCLAYLEAAETELEELQNSDALTEQLRTQMAEYTAKAEKIAGELSAARKRAAAVLSAEIEKSLSELDMEKAKFEVSVITGGELSAKGADTVELMLAPNPGEPPKPLAKIASGGELSRVMLAIKSVLADSEGVDTLIFDEIDTGVSGNAAGRIAKKLAALGRSKQIICISHHPQLAAAADSHYLIEKQTDGSTTRTTVKRLTEEERIAELARITDGTGITETSLKHAEEMRAALRRSADAE